MSSQGLSLTPYLKVGEYLVKENRNWLTEITGLKIYLLLMILIIKQYIFSLMKKGSA